MGRNIRLFFGAVLTAIGLFYIFRGIEGHYAAPKYEAAENVIIIFGALLTAWGIRMLVKKPGTKAAEAQTTALETLDARNAAIIDEFRTDGPLAPIQATGMTPQAGEAVYLQQEANAYTVQIVTTRKGHHQGISVPVGHGIRLNTGTFQSAPQSHTGFGPAGRGMLYLTNHRLVFIAGMSNMVIQRSHVLNVEPFKDGMRIDITGGKPVIFITGDFRFYATYSKLLAQERGTTWQAPTA